MSRRAPTSTERGVLRPHREGSRFELRRHPPSADLAGVVERHWVVDWDLRPGETYTVELLPHPCVNLVFAGGTATFEGPGTVKFGYPLSGQGAVYGVKLRPGAGYPFVRRPLAALTDQTLSLSDVLGPEVHELAGRVARADDDAARIALAEPFLRAHLPTPDPAVELVQRIVLRLLTGSSLERVEDVAAEFALSMRSLQRLFHRYVGVAPKQVMRRYRQHEAADRIAEGPVEDWSAFAADLGYFDQSHFVRDFTAAVGCSPTAYASRCRADLHAARVPADSAAS